jgi:DNA-binding FrmR family transcriptional regulator
MYNQDHYTHRGYRYTGNEYTTVGSLCQGPLSATLQEANIDTEISSPQKEVVDRLKRIEGQVRGLQRMIGEQRDCTEIVTQVLAARSALEQVGVQLLDQQLYRCFPGDDPNLEPLRRSLRMWVKFGTG